MFRNQTAIITGASSGLGAALACELASQGANLVLFSRREEKLKNTAGECEKLGARTLTVAGDVTIEGDCKRLIEASGSEFGGLDYLITNAGLSMWTKFEDVEDLTVYRRLMDTNYFGMLYCVFHALPDLRTSKGMVVAISSIQGKIGVPFHTGYVASKHAVEGFLASLRMELDGSGVEILSVLPHWLRGTDMRSRALGKDGKEIGQASRKHNDESISIDDCCKAITKAMKKRKRELILPTKLKFLPWLNLIHPGILETIVKWKVSDQD